MSAEGEVVGKLAKILEQVGVRDAEKLGEHEGEKVATKEGDKIATTEVDRIAGDGLTAPGPYAGKSIPARGPGRDFTAEERQAVNDIGRDTGCHRCGNTDPGTKSGNHVPDHQPPSKLNTDGKPQRLYPHCINCSRKQGLAIARMTRRARGR